MFTITRDDITPLAVDLCPALGIPLGYARSDGKLNDHSPTIDRIDNTLGYVPGNIVVVSWRANAIKRNATLAELEAVTAYYRGLQATIVP